MLNTLRKIYRRKGMPNADTYSAVDGQSLQVQSYRFTRRSN